MVRRYGRRTRWGRRSSYSTPSPYTIRKNKLQALAKNPTQFYNEVFSSTSEYIESIGRLRELIQMAPIGIIKDPNFHFCFGCVLASVLESNICIKKKSNWSGGPERLHNAEYTKFITYCTPFIDHNAKSKIIDMAIKYNKNFYSYARKSLSKISTDFLTQDDSRSIDVLREFYRIIPTKDFDILMKKVPNGFDNTEAKKILSKTKLFEYLKYDEETINNSFNEKVKLTRAVAKTPTLIKRLPFILHIGKEHIKKISPATRFKFVQFAFKYEVMTAKRHGSWMHGQRLQYKIDAAKSKVKENKLVVDHIGVEEMKELLFAICLQKNVEFVEWIKNYEKYLTKIGAAI